ncbi:hypothetical protein OHV13_28855 [Kitasatospora purpeofusca]|uniref:hypothetical protein n=1 Tax=Kitasatospora purpeofusca TaxID=67352 RepID=UPI0032458145
MPPKIPEPTGKTRAALITAYTNRTPVRVLAEGHRVSEATLTKWLRNWEATRGPLDSDPRVDREEATRLYTDGTALSALMGYYGVTRRRMEILFEAWNVPLRTHRNPEEDTRVDREEATRLYSGGTPAQALAQRYGVTPDRIKRLLRTWGIPLRTRKQAAQYAVRAREEAQARALDSYRLFP